VTNEFEQAKMLYENAIKNIDRIKNNEFKIIISMTGLVGFILNYHQDQGDFFKYEMFGCIGTVSLIKFLFTVGTCFLIGLIYNYQFNDLERHRRILDRLYSKDLSHYAQVRNGPAAAERSGGDNLIFMGEVLYLLCLMSIVWIL
jgi:hypothetical protein